MSALRALAVVSVLVACANGAAVTGPKAGGSEMGGQIVGGNEASEGQFPHMVSVQVVVPWFLWIEAPPQHICGGALIAPNWVLTAAICVYSVPAKAKRVEAVVGINDLAMSSRGSQRITVVKKIAHPFYMPDSTTTSTYNDIGLLKLSSNAELSDSVKLASLPAGSTIPSGQGTLSGWGSTSGDVDHLVMPNKLQTADYSLMDMHACEQSITKIIPSYVLATSSSVCLAPAATRRPCSGDNGSPLIQTTGNNTVVIGVVAGMRKDCGGGPMPTVLTSVSSFTLWLEATQKSE